MSACSMYAIRQAVNEELGSWLINVVAFSVFIRHYVLLNDESIRNILGTLRPEQEVVSVFGRIMVNTRRHRYERSDVSPAAAAVRKSTAGRRRTVAAAKRVQEVNPTDVTGASVAAQLSTNGPRKSTDEPRVRKSNDEPRARKSNDEPRVRKSNDEPRVRKSDDELRVRKSTDEARVRKSTDEARVRKSTDGPRMRKSTDEPRVRKSNDEPRVRKSNDEPRVRKPTDQPRVKKPTDQPRVKKPTDQPRTRKFTVEPRMRKSTDEPRMRKSTDESPMDATPSILDEKTEAPQVSQKDSSSELKPESVPSGDSKKKEADKENVATTVAQKTKQPIRGKNKSNRFWKEPRGRSTSIIKGPHIHKGWEKQKRIREELSRVKLLSRTLVQERAEAKEAARVRTEENRKRKEENQRKSEIVQVIKNTSKIKKMKKKQLRMIQKRDTTAMAKK